MSNEYKDWIADKLEDMTPRQKKIYDICMEYPFLIPEDEKYDYSYLGLEIPKGWFDMFLQMCSDIKPILEKEGMLYTFHFTQVKEKYNMLTCYYPEVNEEFDMVISRYKHMARYVCCECGSPAHYETQGYIASYCEDCLKEKDRGYCAEPIEFKDWFEIKGCNNGRMFITQISFEEEWNRYLK